MILKDCKLIDLIAVFDNRATSEECNSIVKWFLDNEDRHVDGMVYGNKQTSNQTIKDFKIARQIYPLPQDSVSDLITKIIFKGFSDYSNIYPFPHNQPLCAKDYSVRVYHKDTGCFKEHIDQVAGTVTRIFAVIFYLNDVEEGGETEFPQLEVKVSPVKGRLLIFPCNYLFRHSGNIPISDDKFVITAFINFVEVN